MCANKRISQYEIDLQYKFIIQIFNSQNKIIVGRQYNNDKHKRTIMFNPAKFLVSKEQIRLPLLRSAMGFSRFYQQEMTTKAFVRFCACEYKNISHQL